MYKLSYKELLEDLINTRVFIDFYFYVWGALVILFLFNLFLREFT